MACVCVKRQTDAPGVEVKKKSTVHSMTAEGRFVNRLIVEGKVKHLVP